MLYPCSPSLQSLPVPGIGFCQSIFVDRGAVDQPRLGPISTDRTSRDAIDVAAVGHRLQ